MRTRNGCQAAADSGGDFAAGGGGIAGEVDGGVDVSVQDEATYTALVDAVGQREVGLDLTAPGARLGRGEPPVRNDELGAVPGGLVLDLEYLWLVNFRRAWACWSAFTPS